MTTEFVTSVEQEGKIEADPVQADKEEKETPAESSAETKPEDDKTASPAEKEGEDETPESKKDESEKGEKPAVFSAFHKHPKWRAMNEELGELRKFREVAQPLLEKLGKPAEKTEETEEMPEWFTEVFGENDKAWGKFQNYNATQRKQLRTDILKEIQDQSQKASDDTKKWDKQIDTELTDIVSDDEVIAKVKELGVDLGKEAQAKSFRNELLKLALDYQPIGEDGQISLRKALDILLLTKGKKEPEKKSTEKKEVADKTMKKGKTEEGKKDFKTSFDLQGKSFRDLVPDEE